MTNRSSLDRTITLGLLFTIVVETASALVWAGGMEIRVSALELAAAQTQPINLRLTRLEAQMDGVSATLRRIERDIEALEPKDD